MKRRDAYAVSFLILLAVLQFSPILFTGRSYFIGDLTYFLHPWHALSTELLQRGTLPLWNPYAYMGMPLHGNMQGAIFAPCSLPFYLFDFAPAYKVQLLLNHLLASLLAFCWMRPQGRSAATLAGTIFSLGGFMTGHPQLINWIATLAWWPAFFLFSGRPLLLALAAACSLSAGYPPIWAGMAASTLALRWIWRWKRLTGSGLGLALSLGVAAIMLLPGYEFLRRSTRSSGVPAADRTIISLAFKDLAGYLHPIADPALDNWEGKFHLSKLFYVGWIPAGLTLAGLFSLGRGRRACALIFMTGSLLLILGANNPLSSRLWSSFPLIFLRAPAFFSFLPLAVVIPLAALALRRRRWAPLACLAACLELFVYGRGIAPSVPDGYFSSAGPFVSRLQEKLQDHRFMASPLASRDLHGWGRSDEEMFFDIKHRLYGLSNLPFHISAATGLGESMMLKNTDELIDFLFRLPGAEKAKPYLPWIDARILAVKDLGSTPKKYLWSLSEHTSAARAWWVPAEQAARLAGPLEQAPLIEGALPLNYTQQREDKFEVRGSAPSDGAVFVSNALYPGWEASNGDNGTTLFPAQALGAFMRVSVGTGEFRLRFRYRAKFFELGVMVTLACLLWTLSGLLFEAKRLRST